MSAVYVARQAWRKIRDTPKYKNKRAQYIEDWEAQHSASGGDGSGVGGIRAARRSSKVKAKRPAMSPEDEAHIQDLVDSEVRNSDTRYGPPLRILMGCVRFIRRAIV